MTPPPLRARAGVLLAACAALFYSPLGSRALWNPSEGRYAEIAREMLELKSWILPHLNYVPYFEKPPLLYWLTALSFKIFGQTEFAARFWPATFGLLTVYVTYLFGRRWKGVPAGLISAAILATSALFFAYTQYLSTAMAGAFWQVLALYAAAGLLVERFPDRQRRSALLYAFALAGAAWTSGVSSIFLPLAVLALAFSYARAWSHAAKIPWAEAGLLFALLMAPWIVMAVFENASFLSFFFSTGTQDCRLPFYGAVPMAALGFFPWVVFLPPVFASLLKHRAASLKRDPVKALLVIASLTAPLVFTVLPFGELASLLTVLPALALLMGDAFEEASESRPFPLWMARGLGALASLFGLAILALKYPLADAPIPGPVAGALRLYASPLAFFLAVAVMVQIGVWGTRRLWPAVLGLAGSQAALLAALAMLAPAIDAYYSNRNLAQVIRARSRPSDIVAAYHVPYARLQTLPFYLERRVAIFGEPAELEAGAEQAIDRADWFYPPEHSTETLAKMPPGTWVVTTPEAQKSLALAGTARLFDPIAHEGTLVLLRKIK